uniref:Ankyrin repeat protein n=1 Tax=viral metagenome TaxID=1070528 RepID=A0A6C0KUR6_9ZZZZ
MNSYLKISDLLETDLETIKSTHLTKIEKEQLLHFASGLGRKDVIVYLCKETDVDIHHQNDHVLEYALLEKHFDIVEFLYTHDNFWEPICLEHSILMASRDNTTWLKHFVNVLKMPFEEQTVNKALLYAVESDNIGSFEYIATFKGANLFDNQISEKASNLCSFKIIDFLLKRGVKKENFSRSSIGCTKLFRKMKINAVNKIGTWWIPFCYDLNRDSGQRMMWNSWNRVEREMLNLIF